MGPKGVGPDTEGQGCGAKPNPDPTYLGERGPDSEGGFMTFKTWD